MNNLKNHVKSTQQKTNFGCNECGETQNIKNRITMHEQKAHGKRGSKCGSCKAKTETNLKVVRNMNTK